MSSFYVSHCVPLHTNSWWLISPLFRVSLATPDTRGEWATYTSTIGWLEKTCTNGDRLANGVPWVGFSLPETRPIGGETQPTVDMNVCKDGYSQSLFSQWKMKDFWIISDEPCWSMEKMWVETYWIVDLNVFLCNGDWWFRDNHIKATQKQWQKSKNWPTFGGRTLVTFKCTFFARYLISPNTNWRLFEQLKDAQTHPSLTMPGGYQNQRVPWIYT